MYSKFFLVILLFGSAQLSAQQHVSSAPTAQQGGVSAAMLPKDPTKLAEMIRGSYYHPDELSSIDCGVSIDWPAFFGSLKVDLPEDRAKVLQGLKVHSHAVRGKGAEIAFDWSAGELATKDKMEGGLKQMVDGFYQMYWPMLATKLIASGDEVKKVEILSDGSANIDVSSQNTNLVLTVDKSGSPTHWALESPAMKATIDPRYVTSPKPTPGDLRRISSVKVAERIGESSMNVQVDLDYQEADGFFVPKSASFDLLGAYSVTMEFLGCSTTKRISEN
jgi:hypothetical protein